MDIFIEQMVKKKRKLVDFALVAIIMMLGLILSALAVYLILIFVPYMIFISFIIVFAFMFFAIRIAQGTKLEYEYSVTNQYLVIDKIIAKRRRKNVVDIKMSNIDTFCKINDKRLDNIKINKSVFACEDYEDEDTYVIVYHDPKYGTKAVAFNPNDEIFNAMRPYLKGSIVAELFYKKKQA